MADGEDNGVGVDLLAGREGKATDVAVGVEGDVVDAGREAVFSAQGFDPGADAFNDGDEAEGADVGFAAGQDLFGGAGLDKRGEQFAGQVAGIFYAAVELAVGEGAGATLTELDVGFGVEDGSAPQAPGVLGAFADQLAAFKDEGTEAHFGEGKGGEKTAGTGADDHWAGGRGGDVDWRAVACFRRWPKRGVAGEDGGFIPNADVERVNQADGGRGGGRRSRDGRR